MAVKKPTVDPAPRRRWCTVTEGSGPAKDPAPSSSAAGGFRTVHTDWFVDVPSERAAPAVVIPKLPKRPPPLQPKTPDPQGVRVWVVPTPAGIRIVPASRARPIGAKLMRLVAEELDPESRALLDALASR